MVSILRNKIFKCVALKKDYQLKKPNTEITCQNNEFQLKMINWSRTIFGDEPVIDIAHHICKLIIASPVLKLSTIESSKQTYQSINVRPVLKR